MDGGIIRIEVIQPIQGRSEPLMYMEVQLKNFRIAWNNFRTKFFTIFSIVSDVAIMQRASSRLN